MAPFTPDELLALWYREKDCGDCGAPIGSAHDECCDVARCLHTGLQRLSCDGQEEDGTEHDEEDGTEHDCGQAVHDGHWPGERECAEYGWYLYFGGQAQPDVNRLILQGVWDRERGRWVPRDGSWAGTVDAAMEWFLGGSLVVRTSELDPLITVHRSGVNVRVTRRSALDAAADTAWALRMSAEHGTPDITFGDGTHRITLDRAQARELADILVSLHVPQDDATEAVEGRTQVPKSASPETRTRPSGDS